jgi:hypothetical protein
MLSRLDFWPLLTHFYEFLLKIRVGLPNNSMISSNMVDLKNIYYAENDEKRFQIKVKETKILSEKDYRK